MAETDRTRGLSKPVLALGGCAAFLAWLIPLVGHVACGAGARRDAVIWAIAWPAVYAVAVGFAIVIDRVLDLNTAAWVFGAPRGPAPRWAHLAAQVIVFVGPPLTILLGMARGLLEKLAG